MNILKKIVKKTTQQPVTKHHHLVMAILVLAAFGLVFAFMYIEFSQEPGILSTQTRTTTIRRVNNWSAERQLRRQEAFNFMQSSFACEPPIKR